MKQNDRSQHSPQQGRGTNRQHQPQVCFQILPVSGNRGELARPESNGIGCIRLDRQNANAQQRRKR